MNILKKSTFIIVIFFIVSSCYIDSKNNDKEVGKSNIIINLPLPEAKTAASTYNFQLTMTFADSDEAVIRVIDLDIDNVFNEEETYPAVFEDIPAGDYSSCALVYFQNSSVLYIGYYNIPFTITGGENKSIDLQLETPAVIE